MSNRRIEFAIIWLVVLSFSVILTVETTAQETERRGLAIEFPELNSGKITAVRSEIATANLSVIKFWLLAPIADSVDYSQIRVRINNESANRACSQAPSTEGKVLRCDLNRYFSLRLQPKQNIVEIEAQSTDKRRFYAAFNLITNPAAIKPSSPGVSSGNSPLGFSGRKFAVILGVSKYKYNDAGLGNLAYADADADELYRWLTTKGGFMPADVLRMTNEAATLNAVRYSLEAFLTKATETDLILFYFAGHGTPDPFNPKELYYLVHDSKVANLKETGFPMIDLKNIIDRNLRSKRAIFFLDTCHSAGLSGKKVVGFTKSAQGGRDIGTDLIDDRQLKQVEVKNAVNETAGRLFNSTGRAILTSSDVGEVSRESNRWGGGHGVFTWAIIEGLNGKSDANGDRVITADELFTYVQSFVRTETNSKQNPKLFSSLAGALEVAVVK